MHTARLLPIRDSSVPYITHSRLKREDIALPGSKHSWYYESDWNEGFLSYQEGRSKDVRNCEVYIQSWIATCQPAWEKVDGQRKTVHFGKQRNYDAANPPRERQSREVLVLVKLKAKIMKIRELIMTRDQRPYAGILFMWNSPGCAHAGVHPYALQHSESLSAPPPCAYASIGHARRCILCYVNR